MADYSITGDTRLDTKGFTDGISSMTVAAGTLIADLVKSAGTQLAGLAKTSIETGSEFEKSLAKVSTIADSSKLSAKEMGEQILATSSDMGIAATDIAEAAYQAISAGQDTANAVNFAGQAAKLAAAGFTTSAAAVDILTTALNAYGMSADEANHVSDVLLTTQNLGKTSVAELSSTMGRVIPLAAAYSVSIENLSSTLAVLTANGIATAEATTYTKSMLNELGDSGSTVGKILQQQTGMSFAQLNAEGKSLGDVLQILYDSVDGDSTAFAGLWSSVEAGTGALSLASGGADKFNGVLAQMVDSAGATETAYETMTGTFQHNMESLQTAASNLSIILFDSLKDNLSEVAQWGTDCINTLSTALSEGGPEAMLSAAGDILSSLAAGISQKLPGLMTAAVEIITQLTQDLSNSLPAILDTAGEILSALVQGLVDNIPQLLSCAVQIISDLALYLADNAGTIMDSGIQLVESLITGITDNLPQLITSAAVLVARFAAALIQHLPDILACGGAFLTTLVDGIVRGIENLAEAALACVAELTGIWDGSVEDFGHIGENIINGLWEGIKNTWDTVIQSITGLVDLLPSVVKNILGIHSPSRVFAEIGLNICRGLAQGLTSNTGLTEDAAKQMVASVTSTASQLLDGIETTTRTVTEILADGTEQQKQVITETYDDIVDGALVTIQRVTTLAADGTQQVAETVKASSADSFDGLWKELQDRAELGVLGTVDDLYDAVKDKDWKGIGSWVAKTIYNGLTADQKKQIESYALGLIDDLNSVLHDAAGKLSQAAWDIGSKLYDGITNRFSDILSSAKSLGVTLRSTFSSLKEPLASAAKAISSALSGGLLSSFPTIYASMGTLIGSIGAAFQGMLTAISAALDATGIGVPVGLVVAGAAVALGVAIAAIVSKLGGKKGSASSPSTGGGSSGSGGSGSGSMDGDITITPDTDGLEDAIKDNTAALAKTNAALADMVRQAGSLVLSDNMQLGSTVAASGTAQVAAAAGQYKQDNTTINQYIYSKAQSAADLQREARWQADEAKSRKR